MLMQELMAKMGKEDVLTNLFFPFLHTFIRWHHPGLKGRHISALTGALHRKLHQQHQHYTASEEKTSPSRISIGKAPHTCSCVWAEIDVVASSNCSTLGQGNPCQGNLSNQIARAAWIKWHQWALLAVHLRVQWLSVSCNCRKSPAQILAPKLSHTKFTACNNDRKKCRPSILHSSQLWTTVMMASVFDTAECAPQMPQLQGGSRCRGLQSSCKMVVHK